VTYRPGVWPILLLLACWVAAPTARAELRATVRLGSGFMFLQNTGEEAISLTGYTIGSESGSLRPLQWQAITDRLDQDGSGAVDVDDSWVILSPLQPFPITAGDLSEGVFTGDGGFLAPGQIVSLGGVWNPAGELDVSLVITNIDAAIMPIDIYYIPSADFNLDGVVDALDYVVWRNSLGDGGVGLLADANGDGLVNGADYTNWRNEFGNTQFMAPGALHAPALAIANVPEPAGVGLVALMGIAPALYLARSRYRGVR
jgi:hypothetical protein